MGVALVSLLSSCLGCSLTKMPEILSMPALFSRAPTVIHARTTAKNETENLATLQVYCVFKHGGNNNSFPEVIQMTDFVHAPTCFDNPDFELGTDYIFALQDDFDGR